MNVNEVIANRALQLADRQAGDYEYLSPLDHVNLHQSTNDTYPTAVKVAALLYLKQLEASLIKLQESFQEKEKEFRSVIKIGRTEMRDAVPMTLGVEFSGFAEAFAQDRWRVFKAHERLRMLNLGGTAVGTGLTAPREYIFMVTDKLKELTGCNLCRAENLAYPTQNADSFVEASGIVKTCAVNLMKSARDLRLLAMLGEITFEPVQAGSSIMPGKVNPVLCETVIQASLKSMSHDALLSITASLGTLQINEFLPVIASSLLESLRLLVNATVIMQRCVDGVRADEKRCRDLADASAVIMTAFVPQLGYDGVLKLFKEYEKTNDMSVRDFLNTKLGKEKVDRVLAPENLTRVGFAEREIKREKNNG